MITMYRLDTVESLSVEVKSSKVANLIVLVALSSTLSSTFSGVNLVKIFLVL